MVNYNVHDHKTRKRSHFYGLCQSCKCTENSPCIKGANVHKFLNHLKQLAGKSLKLP